MVDGFRLVDCLIGCGVGIIVLELIHCLFCGLGVCYCG